MGELVVADFFPLGIGMLLMNAHVFTFLTWIGIAVLGTQTHHCGFKWPWALWDHQPELHDRHHEAFNGNYGNVGWLDALHGTNLTERRPAYLEPWQKLVCDNDTDTATNENNAEGEAKKDDDKVESANAKPTEAEAVVEVEQKDSLYAIFTSAR